MKNDDLRILHTGDIREATDITNILELYENIKEIEKVFRNSNVYKKWVYWVRNKHGQHVCQALNIDVLEYDKIRLEIHHDTITLWEICYIVGCKLLSERESINIFDIVSEVSNVHLDMELGVVPLTQTYHQMYHSGLYKIKSVYGDYQAFIDKYKKWIEEDMLSDIQDRIDSYEK